MAALNLLARLVHETWPRRELAEQLVGRVSRVQKAYLQLHTSTRAATGTVMVSS